MLSIPYGKIYRFRCWNVGDIAQRAATAGTVKGVVTTFDEKTGAQVDQGNMVFAADGDMHYDIPAEVAVLGRYARIIALITTTDGVTILDTESYHVQYTDS